MTAALARVRTARMQLLLALLASAALWGGVAALMLLVAGVLADVLAGLPLAVRGWMTPAMAVAAVAAGGFTIWRGKHVASLPRVALWIEERTPSLSYALVTAVELGGSTPAGLEHEVAARGWDADVARAAARAIARPLIPLILGLAAVAALPGESVTRLSSPVPGDAIDRVPLGDESRRPLLSPLAATIRPPAYTGARANVVDEPVAIAALPGSAITLRGRGDHRRVSADVNGTTVYATPEPNRWRIDLSVPQRALAVRLRDEGTDRQRLLTLEPLIDEAPVVMLLFPVRDTVMRVARGQFAIEAEARDDYGIGRAAFEYIISSGSGELFQFRSGTIGQVAGGGARHRSLRASLSLDSLALGAGDVVHLRAVAWDANDVGGPGMGASETRTIRIARPDEYDTVAVEGAAPPDLAADAVSQRMLIIQTERLEGRRQRLTRDSLVAESRQLAQRQNLLRRRVAEVVFMRLGVQPDAEHSHGPGDGHDHSDDELAGFLTPERLLQQAGAAISAQGIAALGGHAHDESPILAINQPLLEAYNHMWEAAGELEIGEPARALPPMRRALDALQKAREAERYYLRARSPAVVVDIARVRLAAPQNVRPSGRTGVSVQESPRARLSARLSAAIELLVTSAEAATDSLMLVRLDALEHAPLAAPALAEAMMAVRSGRDATEPLVRARRAVDGAITTGDGGKAWRGGW